MPGKPKYSSNLHSSRQSTGGRPLIVLCLVSLLLLTFYLREGDTGMIHSLRGAAMTITSPVRMLGGAVAAPFNAIGNAIGNAGASSETLSELKKENERLTAKVATSPVRMLGGAVAAPFNAIGNAIGNAGASSETLSELKKENERLTAKVAELSEAQETAARLEKLVGLQSTYSLKSTAARIIGSTGDAWSDAVIIDKGLSEAQETAARLEKLVGLQSTYSLKSTAARIIGSTGDAWSDAVIIDKGANAGFEVGMPVCSSGGVIGKLIEVSDTTSTVRLVCEEQSGISAKVQGSSDQGMLRGQADGTLRLEYVVSDAEVSAGDIIITSGIGGSFPKGLPLGTVASINRAANAVYYTIVVRPASTAENNEEVLVITSLGDDQVASDDEVAAANNSPQGGPAKQQDDATDSDGAADADAPAGE